MKSQTNLPSQLIKEIEEIVGKENVSINPVELKAYSRDILPREIISLQYGKLPSPPQLVVWPGSTEEVRAVAHLADKYQIPIIPLGGASGVCGGTIALRGGITIDLKRMNRILNIDEISLLAEVESGIIGEWLERKLNQKGYTLGHFPSSIYCSTLGGWIATRGAGQLSSKYGKIEDMVVSLEVVLPDGSLLRTRTVPRSATGPSLNHIFIGSEGTLGIITKAVLRIWKYPEERIFQGFMFPDLHQALTAIRLIFQQGLKPAVVRLYDPVDTFFSSFGGTLEEKEEKPKKSKKEKRALINLLRRSIPYIYHPWFANRLIQRFAHHSKLVLVFEGESETTALEHKIACQICKEQGGIDLGEAPAKNWWKHRYRVSYTMSVAFDFGFFVDTIEVATLWDNLENLYYTMQRAISKNALVMAHFSHAYREGCSIYFSIASTAKTYKDKLRLYDQIWKDALDACQKAGGALSHHHGIGFLKAKWMQSEQGGASPLLSAIKRAIDPKGIMNPGKLGI